MIIGSFCLFWSGELWESASNGQTCDPNPKPEILKKGSGFTAKQGFKVVSCPSGCSN